METGASPSKIAKWVRWIDGPIKNDVIQMHGHRAMYREVVRITQEHGELPPSSFFTYLGNWYGTSQSAAVRRQAEVSPRVTSLGTLLRDIAAYPRVLSREWYLGFGDDDWERRDLGRTFDRIFAGARAAGRTRGVGTSKTERARENRSFRSVRTRA